MSLTPFCGPNCGSAVPGFPLGEIVHGADWHETARRRHERADLARSADEVMGRAYDQLVEAAQHLTVQHPAAEPVGRAIDYLAGWLGRRTIIIGKGETR